MISKNAKASQEFVPIRDIRDGVVILKDNSMRMVLLVSSINFGLKSKEEQAAIILQFQNFLNGIEFSLQITIQSKRLDIHPYLNMLDEREKAQLTDLMKIQTREYIRFIKTFAESVNIMSKSFFAVVPYRPTNFIGRTNDKPTGLLGMLGGKGSKPKKINPEQEMLATQSFKENKIQMEQRLAVVEQGLARTGLRTTVLGTDELIELFYRKFNPGELDKAT